MDDEYETDDENEFILATTKLASPQCGSEPTRAVGKVIEILDGSWTHESDDSCSDDDRRFLHRSLLRASLRSS